MPQEEQVLVFEQKILEKLAHDLIASIFLFRVASSLIPTNASAYLDSFSDCPSFINN